MTDRLEIVDRLGGPEALAARFCISVKAIEMWARRGGIPGRWHIPMLLLAGELGVPLSLDDLSRTTTGAREPASAEMRA